MIENSSQAGHEGIKKQYNEIEKEMKTGWMKMNQVEVAVWLSLHFVQSQTNEKPVPAYSKLFSQSFSGDKDEYHSIRHTMTDIAKAWYPTTKDKTRKVRESVTSSLKKVKIIRDNQKNQCKNLTLRNYKEKAKESRSNSVLELNARANLEFMKSKSKLDSRSLATGNDPNHNETQYKFRRSNSYTSIHGSITSKSSLKKNLRTVSLDKLKNFDIYRDKDYHRFKKCQEKHSSFLEKNFDDADTPVYDHRVFDGYV